MICICRDSLSEIEALLTTESVSHILDSLPLRRRNVLRPGRDDHVRGFQGNVRRGRIALGAVQSRERREQQESEKCAGEFHG